MKADGQSLSAITGILLEIGQKVRPPYLNVFHYHYGSPYKENHNDNGINRDYPNATVYD